MNRFILWLLFTILTLTAVSQKVYFVYLQTETPDPFFVKINDKVYSSSASGYMVLSKLRDTLYHMTVGFPQNKWPESNFVFTVAGKDHGFLLKNFGDKGWGLFDLQSLAVQMPVAMIRPETQGKQEKSVSAFTEILSKAADDPSLRVRAVVASEEEDKKEEVKKQVALQEMAVKKETKPAIVEPAVVITTKPSETVREPVVQKKEEPKVTAVVSYVPSVVTKEAETPGTEGVSLIYIDQGANGIRDTIRLLIPNPMPEANAVKEKPKEEVKSPDVKPENAQVKKQVSEVKEKPKEELKFLEFNTDTTAKKPIVEVKEKPAGKVEVNVKKACAVVAQDKDFFTLRKQMAAESTDDKMIATAKKYFANKCFTTGQLKNLGALFLSDGGKYQFFFAAHPFVADEKNFSSLREEMKDIYYINRFNAMLH